LNTYVKFIFFDHINLPSKANEFNGMGVKLAHACHSLLYDLPKTLLNKVYANVFLQCIKNTTSGLVIKKIQ